MNQKKKIIGIDLGTSTTEAAILVEGKPFLIPSFQGEQITPSVIGIENGNFLVGEEARERQLLYPEDTVVEVKRKMGETKKVRLAGKFYSPEELSAKILSHVKAYAEAYLKESIENVVITVPAYFNNEQRKATIEAGRLAGFQVERILNEPTAAALCYGLEHIEEESKILVYDFGGGTFDVTLLEMFDGVLEVKASSGNNELGGKEFDQRLVDFLLGIIKEKYQVDVSHDVYAMVKLREAAIACKITLSSQESYEVVLPMLATVGGTPVNLEETITVSMFEEMIADLVEKTRRPIEIVLQDSGFSSREIDIILLVGGSTKVPYIARFVENLLGKKPERLVDPVLAVALGAAVQAGILSEEIDSAEGIMITDVSPYALGISVLKEWNGLPMPDFMDILIPRNTTIPVTKTKRYETSADNQRSAIIDVYQGEEQIASRNLPIGKFEIGEFPRGKAGKEKIDVCFSYNVDGILEVSAKIVSTGKEASVCFNLNEIEQEDVDLSKWDKSPLARKFRSTIRKAEKWLNSQEMDTVESIELEELVDALKEAIVLGQEVEEIEEIESDILDLFDEIM